MEGKQGKNGLYEINLGNNKETCIAESKDSIKELHVKLGHLSINNMKKLSKMADGVEISNSDKDFDKFCEVCLKAKHVRQPFSSERARATRPLKSAIDPPTWDNKKKINVRFQKNKCEEEVEEESERNATVFEKFADDKENTDEGNSEDKDLTENEEI
ncbi:GAG-pre-integrase domain [Popillia japonica]|uniref:GAG-pre-integrase domain n=1 Tax=Popillia japonica TaxID=7064 RepID=A0AAW1L5T9_POPJA